MLGYMIIGGFIAATVLPGVVTILVPHLVGSAWRAVRPKIRGASGERKVNRLLRAFKGEGFARIKDAMVQVNGKTSQIDNVLVSRHGIFVFEAKNYFGVVLGDARSAKWEQIYPGTRKNSRTFPNPIWQNNGHIKALREILGHEYPNLKFHNVVVFTDKCDIPKISGVVKLSGLFPYLVDKMQGPPILTAQEVADIKQVIEKSNIKDRSKRAEHVDYAKYTGLMSKERDRRKQAMENKDTVIQVRATYSGQPSYSDTFVTSLPRPSREKPTLSSQVQSAAKVAGAAQSGEHVRREKRELER